MEKLLMVIKLGLSTLPARRGAALVVVVGMACAIGAMVSVQSMAEGLSGVVNMGRDDRAVVLSKGVEGEFGSNTSHADAITIQDAPGIARSRDGRPAASPQMLAFAAIPKLSDGLDAFVTMRGVGPQGMAVFPDIKLIEGRMFAPGRYELIAGRAATAMFKGLKLGQRISLPGGDWTVTGIFTSGGDTHESEIITDADTLLAALHAPNYKSEEVMLSSPAAMQTFKKALAANPALSVDVKSEREYLAQDWKSLTTLLTTVAWLVGGIMGFGALLGAFNTMFNAVQLRTLEIATLRALGFGGGAVLASVLVEAMVLAMGGALIGMALAWLAFNGVQHSMGGLVIKLSITPHLILTGLIFACLLGLLGGFFPALRAVRLPVATALRAT
jgi:putative ABC transport system permease protein